MVVRSDEVNASCHEREKPSVEVEDPRLCVIYDHER
jgi:hypothetical protein